MSSHGYVFHPEAFTDLEEIWEYIAHDNIDAADRLLADLHAAVRILATSPHIGHRRPDLTARPLRFHVVRDQYLIAYAPDEKPLGIVAVFHGRGIRGYWRRFFASDRERPPRQKAHSIEFQEFVDLRKGREHVAR